MLALLLTDAPTQGVEKTHGEVVAAQARIAGSPKGSVRWSGSYLDAPPGTEAAVLLMAARFAKPTGIIGGNSDSCWMGGRISAAGLLFKIELVRLCWRLALCTDLLVLTPYSHL